MLSIMVTVLISIGIVPIWDRNAATWSNLIPDVHVDSMIELDVNDEVLGKLLENRNRWWGVVAERSTATPAPGMAENFVAKATLNHLVEDAVERVKGAFYTSAYKIHPNEATKVTLKRWFEVVDPPALTPSPHHTVLPLFTDTTFSIGGLTTRSS